MKPIHFFSAAIFALLSLALCLRAADAPAAAAAEAPFDKSTWLLSELNGAKVEKAAGQMGAQSISFDPKQSRASGHGGINRFSGSYKQSGQDLKLGPLMSTRMGGEPAAMQAETKFLSALEGVTGWKWGGEGKDTLQLTKGETVVASFTKGAAR